MKSVYRRTLAAGLATLAAALIASTLLPARAEAQTDPIVDAREALRRKDARRLLVIRDAVVSQRHPLGRVTFVDLETAGTRTVTGFELNSHILD